MLRGHPSVSFCSRCKNGGNKSTDLELLPLSFSLSSQAFNLLLLLPSVFPKRLVPRTPLASYPPPQPDPSPPPQLRSPHFPSTSNRFPTHLTITMLFASSLMTTLSLVLGLSSIGLASLDVPTRLSSDHRMVRRAHGHGGGSGHGQHGKAATTTTKKATTTTKKATTTTSKKAAATTSKSSTSSSSSTTSGEVTFYYQVSIPLDGCVAI